ncbi:MAG: TetR/AcrR family transcriptional regulator [Acetatifactor sp.]
MTTKEKILAAALTLFAEKGYDGVGVDLIAERAGIKGPSMYKHFKGKEVILDTLIDRVEEYYEQHFGSEVHPGSIPTSMEELTSITKNRILFTIHDETVRKTRRLLTMEQFRSERIAELATKHNLTGVQRMYCRIFREMMDAGVLRREDPMLLALQYVAPVSMLIQLLDRETEREAEILERIDAHLRHFAGEYGVSASS